MIIKAIKALGVTAFACDSNPTKEEFERTYRSDSVDNPSITWEQVSAKMVELQAEYDAQEYARNRKEEYPTIAELTVALYDLDDKADIEAKRAEVKAKYPKP